VSPDHILVLVPRKKLGHDFVGYAIAQSKTLGLPSSVTFAFVSKREFSDLEKERLLLFALLARPNSLLHIRTYIGLGDETEFAAEVEALKRKYGNLHTVIDKASADEFPKKRTRIRRLCGRIATLKTFLSAHAAVAEDSAVDLAGVIDELFPEAQVELADVRNMLRQLTEDDDTPETLYAKFVDYMRTIPTDTDTVRVLTLMGSKGLEADHVYIIGSNAGNMPGANRSSTISDHEHKQEARRLLYVGFTRASKSLTVSWSRYIQFRQSKGHHTSSVGTRIFSGQTYSQVGMCEFLEDLGITWKHV
jgi:superfamily I DNA/RNA helicase